MNKPILFLTNFLLFVYIVPLNSVLLSYEHTSPILFDKDEVTEKFP
jgi:hypothetical protein